MNYFLSTFPLPLPPSPNCHPRRALDGAGVREGGDEGWYGANWVAGGELVGSGCKRWIGAVGGRGEGGKGDYRGGMVELVLLEGRRATRWLGLLSFFFFSFSILFIYFFI